MNDEDDPGGTTATDPDDATPEAASDGDDHGDADRTDPTDGADGDDAPGGESSHEDDESDEPDDQSADDGSDEESADDPGDSMGIEAKVERVETIVERLESGDPGLAEAKRLRDEGKRLIADLRADLDADDGDVVEFDDGEE